MREIVLAPLVDDYDAMRREIWLTTGSAYKRAITMFEINAGDGKDKGQMETFFDLALPKNERSFRLERIRSARNLPLASSAS